MGNGKMAQSHNQLVDKLQHNNKIGEMSNLFKQKNGVNQLETLSSNNNQKNGITTVTNSQQLNHNNNNSMEITVNNQTMVINNNKPLVSNMKMFSMNGIKIKKCLRKSRLQ